MALSKPSSDNVEITAEVKPTPMARPIVVPKSAMTIASRRIERRNPGFADDEIAVRNPLDGERAVEHGTVLAQSPVPDSLDRFATVRRTTAPADLLSPRSIGTQVSGHPSDISRGS